MTIYSELEAALAQAKALAWALNALNKTKSLALQESIAAFEVWRNSTDDTAWYAPDGWNEE